MGFDEGKNKESICREGRPGSLLSRCFLSMALPTFLVFILYIVSRKQ